MIVAPLPEDEQARLAAISRYRLDGPGRETVFDHAVQLAAEAFGVPISLVSIVGPNLQCFKGNAGLDAEQTARDVSFCSHAILDHEIMVVEDALEDVRFADNPLVLGAPHVRFYAGAPLVLRHGEVPGTLCLIDHAPRRFPDAERKRLEQLARLVVDLIELRLESAVAAERHKALDRMKDEFLATTSHELRTPITSIVGSLGLLSTFAGQLPERAQRLLQIANDNSKRLARLVNDILDLSKITEATLPLAIEPLDAARVLAEALDANSGFALSRDVTLVARPPAEPLPFPGDPHRLQQILANLVSNAVKFSEPGSCVTLSALRLGALVRFSIADTGRGIPEEFRNRMFQRFEQAEADDTVVKGGTGLGLAIARELVLRMGGKIDFESTLGQGTTFHIDFPLSQMN